MIINRMICLSNQSTMSPLEVQKGDYNSNFVRVTVFETPGVLFDLSDCDVTVVYRKDGVNSSPYDVTIEDANNLLFVFPASVTSEEGKGYLQLAFYGVDGLLHSHMMPFIVKESIGGQPGDASDPSPAFFTLLNEARQSFSNTPYIGEDGDWRRWSVEDQEYVDTNYPATPHITFTASKGAPGTPVLLEQTGTPERPEVHLTIPEGEPGAVDGIDYFAGDPAALAASPSPGESNAVARGDHVHPLPTASQIGALTGDDTAYNSNRLSGKLPSAYIPALNLLDNSNFANPINQRGETIYNHSNANGHSYTYGIDRWATTGKITVNSGSVTVNSGKLVQVVPGVDTGMHADGTPNKTYTFAVGLADGTVAIVSGRFTDGATANGLTIDISDESLHGLVSINSGKTVVWAALYEGEYTAESLPPYVPRRRTDELLECQRYYLLKEGSANSIRMLCAVGSAKQATCTYYMHAPMAKRPTGSIGNVMVRGNGKSVSGQTATTLVTSATDDEIVFAINYDENVLGDLLNHAAVVYTDRIELDADLY